MLAGFRGINVIDAQIVAKLIQSNDASHDALSLRRKRGFSCRNIII